MKNTKDICFYFQVHQPYRLRNYRIFDIGHTKNYFDVTKNKSILIKVAKKCYLPTNNLMLKLIEKYKGNFKIAYSISGMALEQFAEYSPDVLDSFKALANTGCVEFLGETYYHSLAYLYSKNEFKEQTEKHKKQIKELFDQDVKVFRNTELIYSNELANYVEKLGYKIILAEGASHILNWRSSNYVYKSKTTDNLKLLLKNYKLSDDIAFRFSNRDWIEWPLNSEKFMAWVKSSYGHTINLFMDYETFGEHQWADTGIFKFLENIPEISFKNGIGFKTPSDFLHDKPVDEIDMHLPVSWADVERDLSAWIGNKMQNSALHELYALEKQIKQTKNEKLIEDWKKLTTSDHFYYMCTKWFEDGDVHKYFNPFESPYDAYMSFMNVLNDLVRRVRNEKKIVITEKPSNYLNRKAD